MSKQSVEQSGNELQSGEQVEGRESMHSHPLILGKEPKQPKNRKWSDHQHVRYILFLELNRDKIKSKLIRRSNFFYQEMGAFIGNKSGVQCRSHHQKYEIRYKYPHRIIREEKGKIDRTVYDLAKAALPLPIYPSNASLASDAATLMAPAREPAEMRSISCQTQIQGVDKAFLNPEQLNHYRHWSFQRYNYHQSRQAQLMMPFGAPPHLMQHAHYFYPPF